MFFINVDKEMIYEGNDSRYTKNIEEKNCKKDNVIFLCNVYPTMGKISHTMGYDTELSLVRREHVFGVSFKVRHKLGCTARGLKS